eukprot:CAMPEP_0184861262 /NCGR_PEP_ID=MMETSP0580-20130426/5990_1 /TAXON_ID=1118495 /ORGANISM="Dactyliosolen fragilissimus" /LENGTH=148 /DNA_ID=CAMNT_0027358687 /DNA_START=1374 /DNA_END=1820 /DNA_ORIENTATION=+
MNYHNRFSTHVELILENNDNPDLPSEIATMFLDGVNLDNVTNDLYKKVITEKKDNHFTNFNMSPLAKKTLQELQIFNAMNPLSEYDMEGKEMNVQAPALSPSPSLATSPSSLQPSQTRVPAQVQGQGNQDHQRLPLDFAAIDALKTEI